MANESNSLPSDPAVVPPFCLRDWEIRPALNRITNGQTTTQLEPRIMHVLVCLAAQPGEVLSRRRLLHNAWPDMIVGEEALTRTISQLRIALGDDSRSPLYIETIRGGGYRLVAPVTTPTEREGEDAFAAAKETSAYVAAGDTPSDNRKPDLRRWLRTSWLRLAGLAAVCLCIWYFAYRQQSVTPPSFLEAVPFSSYAGQEIQPAFSPDGIRVAFLWHGKEDQQPGIFVKQRDVETPLRITDNTSDRSPTWSPDGSTIAFVRTADRITGIYTVPALGGPVRRLHSTANILSVNWSPDGQWLVFSARDKEDSYPLYLLSPETLEIRQIVSNPAGDIVGASQPVFSPDSRTIAFVQCDHQGWQDLHLVPTDGGLVRKITAGQREIRGFTWIADGKHGVLVGNPEGKYILSRVDLTSGTLVEVPVATEIPRNPVISRADGSLLFEERRHDSNLWLVALGGAPDQEISSVSFANSTREESQARFSADGDRVAFISRRSGNHEIWLADADGTELRQLTNQQGTEVGFVRWAPDGRHIAYSKADDGVSHIYLVDVTSGVSQCIHETSVHENPLGWSDDGQWLYSEYDTDDSWRLQKMRPDGSDVQHLETAWDNKFVVHVFGDCGYAISGDQTGIVSIPLTGGPAGGAVPAGVLRGLADWTTAEGGIVFLRRRSSGFTVEFHEFATDSTRVLATVSGQVGYQSTLAPDGSALIFTRTDRVESDLVLVEQYQ